jgi:hypothetical protein
LPAQTGVECPRRRLELMNERRGGVPRKSCKCEGSELTINDNYSISTLNNTNPTSRGVYIGKSLMIVNSLIPPAAATPGEAA